MKKIIISIGFSLLLIAGFSVNAAAQADYGSLRGFVYSADGFPLPGAEVSIAGEKIMGGQLSLVTDSDGFYRFPRIPIGTYTITVKMDGFATMRKENFKVDLSARTEFTCTLTQARQEEEITVVAEAPVLDQVRPNFNKVIDAKTMDILPINRGGHATELANFNPGDERYGSTLGTGWYGNAYLLDGQDATDPGGGDVWLRPNYEAVEEVEYVYGGANAEYGNFSGSLVKMITKSGSNRFFGSVGFTFTNHRLTDRNTDDVHAAWTSRDNSYDAQLGGPMVKDKLWFFIDATTKPSATYFSYNGEESTYAYNQIIGKMTASFHPKHRTNISTLQEWNTATNWGMSPYAAESTWYDFKMWTHTVAFNHTAFFRENLIFDMNVSYHYSHYKYPPHSYEPQVYSIVTGMVTGGSGYVDHYKVPNFTGYAKFSYYLDDFLGAHEWKIGFDFMRGGRSGEIGFTGGALIYDYGSFLYKITYDRDPWSYDQRVSRLTGFIQDDWTIGKRLTVSLGLRYDLMRGHIPDQSQPDGTLIEGLGTVLKFHCWSPRFGLNYELTGDGKTIARAHFGRYYKTPPSGMLGALNNARPGYTYYMNYGSGWFYYMHYDYNTRAQDPNLQNYYYDTLALAVEREIFKNTSLAVNFIKKWGHNYFGSIARGTPTEVQAIDSFNGETVSVYRYYSGFDWYFTNMPEELNVYERYTCFQIILNKRFADRWYLNMSYHYEDTMGNVDNSYTSQGYVHYGIYADMNDQIFWEGRPTYYSPHQLKITASYILPWNITASTFIQYRSGNPWHRRHFFPYPASTTVNREPKGSRRLPDYYDITLWLRKTFRINRISIELILQVNHLLNKDIPMRYYSTTGSYLDMYFGEPSSIKPPRQGLITARIRF